MGESGVSNGIFRELLKSSQVISGFRCLLPVEGRGLRAPEARDFAEQLMTWHRQGFPELGDANGCGMGRRWAAWMEW